jgi:hypothetical protein
MFGGQRTDDLQLRRWVSLLALAEAVGMTAAAAAARLGQAIVPNPAGAGPVSLAIGLATAGGVVEGAAVGVATAALLQPRAGDLPVRRWIAITTVVAAIGWAAGTVPSALAGTGAESANSQPGRWVVLSGALGLGVLLGAFLGWTQATVLRHRVSFPFRWVGASALAWAPAMAIIFLGATTPAVTWPVVAVLGVAALTGVFAGAVLGLVLGWSAPSLSGTSVLGRLLLTVLRSRWQRYLVPRGVIGLKVRGNRTGTWHTFPVMAAWDAQALIVLPGRPDRKHWWRNLIRPSRVEFWRSAGWEPAEAWVLGAADPAYLDSFAAYRRRYPRIAVPHGAPLVRIVPLARSKAPSPPDSVASTHEC